MLSIWRGSKCHFIQSRVLCHVMKNFFHLMYNAGHQNDAQFHLIVFYVSYIGSQPF